MPFTSQQQLKLDAAQKRNDAAKDAWKSATEFWNFNFIGLKCYTDVKYDVVAAATWFTPTDQSCSTKGSECKTSDKQDCKNAIQFIRDNMDMIRNAYAEFIAAQANYDKVFNEVTAEAAADPQLQLEQAEIVANAAANRLKWIFGISVVVVIGIAAFVWFKWIKK